MYNFNIYYVNYDILGIKIKKLILYSALKLYVSYKMLRFYAFFFCILEVFYDK